jgi:hypothetical protein
MGTTSRPSDVEIRSLDGVFALLQKPQVAALYTRLQEQATTVPSLLTDLDISKTAAYDYCDLLQSAGLVSEHGTDGRSTIYQAHDFEISLRLGDEEMTITPKVVRVLAARTSDRPIDRFVEQYGVATLVRFVTLAEEYADGSMTYRGIAQVLDISPGSAFDTLEAVLSVLDLAPDSRHSRPGDRRDAEVARLIEEARDGG